MNRLHLAIAAALLVVALPAGAVAARGGDDRGRIAFDHHVTDASTNQTTTDVMTIDADGGDPRQLTHSAPGGFSGDVQWGAGNRLYFDSDRAGNMHAFVMKTDGSDVRQLTSGDGFEFTPAPSPDGDLIAYEHDNADFTDGGIYVSDKRGARARRLTTAPGLATGGFDGYPEFSPDGRSIEFLRVLSTDAATAQAAVFVMRLDGRALRQLTPWAFDAGPAHWSPDGRMLTFADKSDNGSATDPQSIWVVRVDGTGLRQVAQTPQRNQYFEPDWAPNGRQIVFVHFSLPLGFFTQLEVINLDGSGQHAISHGADHTFDVRPAWSPAESREGR